MIDSYNVMWLNDNYVIKYSVCGGVSTRMNYSVVFQSIQCFSATSDFGCYLSLARVLVPESQLAPVRIVKSQKVQTRIYRSTETALSPIIIDLTCSAQPRIALIPWFTYKLVSARFHYRLIFCYLILSHTHN